MPYLVDVPLRDGEFTVKAHSRPSHKQIQQITRDTRKRAKEENIEAVLIDNLLTLCEDWDVRDEDGSPIAWSREGLEAAPNDLLMELSDKLKPFVDRGETLDRQLANLAEQMDDDDPRKLTLLEMVNTGN